MIWEVLQRGSALSPSLCPNDAGHAQWVTTVQRYGDRFTFPVVFRHSHSMWNNTAFSEKRSESRSQCSMQKYQYFEWGSTMNLDGFKIIIISIHNLYPIIPIYWEFGQLAKILHFVSNLDTSLYRFTFPVVFRHSHSMWNNTAFSEKRSESRSQCSMQKYQYFEWGSTMNLDGFKIIVDLYRAFLIYRVGNKYIGWNMQKRHFHAISRV